MQPTRRDHRHSRGTTPFPNFLLDRVMPKLRDTEFRLLAVVVRQTCGWVDRKGKRKTSDWLSHPQLKRKTGRSGTAVSRAIEVLVWSKLIVVRDMSGRALGNAIDRRRARSTLFYSLHPRLRMPSHLKQIRLHTFVSLQSENNKRNTYKTKQQHEEDLNLSTGSLPNNRFEKLPF